MLYSKFRSPVPLGQLLAGKYRIEREIGAGAMGVVVEAWHVDLGQHVAIKFLSPGLTNNDDVSERFRREARALARIESEHVAKVLDIGVLEENRTPYFVMEYLRGRDLAQELAERGPLPVGVAVHYVIQACEALAEAHGKGIVHRDLKPANLFLAERPNGSRSIKVLDFGISKIISPEGRPFSLTDTSTLMGSPAYMSPEQLESARNVDARADIWSLGVILHELLLDQLPFQGESVPQLVRAILAGGRAAVTSRRDVSPALEDVVARCLLQNRDERFERVEHLRDALRPFELASLRSPSFDSQLTLQPRTSLSPGVNAAMDRPTPAPPHDEAPLAAPVDVKPPSVHPPAEPFDPRTRSAPTSWGTTRAGQWRSSYRYGALGLALAGGVMVGAYLSLRSAFQREESPPTATAAPPSVDVDRVPTPVGELGATLPDPPVAPPVDHPAPTPTRGAEPAPRGVSGAQPAPNRASGAEPPPTPSKSAPRTTVQTHAPAAAVRRSDAASGALRPREDPAVSRPGFDWGGRE